MTETYKTAVVGGGLAGLVFAVRLAERLGDGSDIVLVDAADSHRGSDSPAAIFHPFPGRSMRPSAHRLAAARTTMIHLERWRASLGSRDVTPTTMVRPLFDDYLGERLRDSWNEYAGSYPEWFEGERLPADDVRDLVPLPDEVDEALVYRPAYVVDLASVCAHLRNRLDAEGVARRNGRVEGLRRRTSGWHLAGTDISAKRTVLALGAGTAEWFPGIPVELRGGELLLGESENAHLLDGILNAGGHVAPIGEEGIVAGSSWFDGKTIERRSDDTAIEDVVERCARLFPSVAELDSPRVWRGVRAAFGDHQPLVGPVPELDDVHVLTAFGSKGLLHIPHHATRLADWLAGSDETLPELADARRMNASTWRPFPKIENSDT